MLISAHQPVYLPWLGLFHKIAVADLFVIYDDVPYSRKMWYNRNRVRGPRGAVMLSVPVRFRHTERTAHRDIEIDNSRNWRAKHWKTLEATYAKAPYFDTYAPAINEIYAREWGKLADLNEAVLRLLLGFFGIDTTLDRSSRYSFAGGKSERVLDMCVTLGADAYLFGALGRDYADIEAFLARGVIPLFQDYRHPTYYEHGLVGGEPYLSAVDLLFCHGPNSREILLSDNPTHDDYMKQGVPGRALAGH